MRSNVTRFPPEDGGESTPFAMQDMPNGFFSRLVLAAVLGWRVLPPVDYQNKVAHGFLETSWAAFVAHLSYTPDSGWCRLRVRLDGVQWTPVLAAPISRLVARIPLVKVTPDPEIRAVMIEAGTLAWDESPADHVLRSLTEAVRSLLDDGVLRDAVDRRNAGRDADEGESDE